VRDDFVAVGRAVCCGAGRRVIGCWPVVFAPVPGDIPVRVKNLLFYRRRGAFETIAEDIGQVAGAQLGLIGLIEQAMEEFSYDCGYYPETLEDLVIAPADCEEWGPSPYLKNGKIPKDPWKQDFVYSFDEEGNYIIMSYGSDRKPGGSGRFNKDISSEDL